MSFENVGWTSCSARAGDALVSTAAASAGVDHAIRMSSPIAEPCRRVLCVLLCALLATACGTTLLNRPIESKAKEWTLVVDKLRDGPNSYGTGNGHIEPESGARFLWFNVRLRNDAAVTRSFNYDRCDVDAGEERLLPSIVDRDIAINAEAPGVEELEPGEEITRILIFTYPEERMPTRLQCGELSIPLNLAQS
jgi:hypothetical protein